MANEKRIKRAFQSGTLGATLSDSGTTITFASAPGFATLAADEHIALILDPAGSAGAPEIVYVTAYSAAATTATIVRGMEGTSPREHLSGAAWAHGPTIRDLSAGRVAWSERTAGNVSVSSTSPVNVDTGTDLVLPALPGDIVEIMPAFRITDSNSVGLRTDFRTVVDGTETNYVSSGTSTQLELGVPGFFSDAAKVYQVTGSFFYRVQAGDVHNGTVMLRWKAWVSTLSRTIQATTGQPARIQARNLGPQEA